MTDEQIRKVVAIATANADCEYLNGTLNEKEYEARLARIEAWATERFAEIEPKKG